MFGYIIGNFELELWLVCVSSMTAIIYVVTNVVYLLILSLNFFRQI